MMKIHIKSVFVRVAFDSIDENLLVINRRINEYKECTGCNVNL